MQIEHTRPGCQLREDNRALSQHTGMPSTAAACTMWDVMHECRVEMQAAPAHLFWLPAV